MRVSFYSIAVLAALICSACSKSPPASPTATATATATVTAPGRAPLAADTLDASQRAEAFRVLDLKSAPDGKVINACDEPVTAAIHSADLGGSVGTAYLIVVGAGPDAPSCYGMSETAVMLLKTAGKSFRPIFSTTGSLAIMPTSHEGVKDIAIGGPGFEFPVLRWNGTEYVQDRMISDREFPAPLS